MFDIENLKIEAKASGNKDAVLRFDFYDNFGNVTNARPQEIVIKNNGGAIEPYYIKMANNFFQRNPEFKTINARNLVKLRIYVNGGFNDTYNGKIEIDDISTIPVDELPEDVFDMLKDK